MRNLASIIALVAVAGGAEANGRDPFISTINFKAGDDSKIVAGATFGLLRSDDGGGTFQWFCERAVGYGGTYDPDYLYTATGAVFATTFDGMKVMRDGCSFVATPPGMTFVTQIARGPDAAIYFSASHPTDTKIYKSTDDGQTFPTSTSIANTPDAWWHTLAVAPSNAQVVYLTGYHLPMKCTAASSNPGTICTGAAMCPGGACEATKEFLLYRSTNGGASFAPMAMTGITPTSQNSTIDVVGVDPTNADIVYARVTLESLTGGDSIYRSNDGGTTWTKILSKASAVGSLTFLVRYDGSCVAGTRDIGAWKSAFVTNTGCGATWDDLTTAPGIGCLVENSAHEVWACTTPTNGYGIMKSADLTAWTGVLRFQDIQAPASCPVGTVQQDRCIDRYMGEQSQWCCLAQQLAITSTAIDCTGPMACFGILSDDVIVADGPIDAPVDGPMVTLQGDRSSGCCDAGAGAPVPLVLLVGALLLRRRRR